MLGVYQSQSVIQLNVSIILKYMYVTQPLIYKLIQSHDVPEYIVAFYSEISSQVQSTSP